MSDIIIKISDEEYTVEEAKELYLELHQLFKTKEYLPYDPYPFPAYPAQPINPYFVTTSGTIKKD